MSLLIDQLETIMLGNQGEAGVTEVAFDVTEWQTLYPTGAAAVSASPGVSDGLYLTYTLPGDATIYTELPANLDLTAEILTWMPPAAVLASGGDGTVVVHCLESPINKCSPLAVTKVSAGHALTGVVLLDARLLITAGDLLTFTTLPVRLPIGTNGQILKSNGTALVWGAETAHNISRYVTPPAAGNSTGTVGDWSADANYIYACHATDTWVRCAITAW